MVAPFQSSMIIGCMKRKFWQLWLINSQSYCFSKTAVWLVIFFNQIYRPDSFFSTWKLIPNLCFFFVIITKYHSTCCRRRGGVGGGVCGSWPSHRFQFGFARIAFPFYYSSSLQLFGLFLPIVIQWSLVFKLTFFLPQKCYISFLKKKL